MLIDAVILSLIRCLVKQNMVGHQYKNKKFGYIDQ
jgi:hypothetical protein